VTVLLRVLARIVVLVLLVMLSLGGFAVAVFSIQGGDRPLSLPGLAEQVLLPEAEDDVGGYLARLEAPGPLAKRSALAGAGAVLAGALLLLGLLAPRRERLVVFDEGARGRLAARRRPLAGAAEALAGQVRGVTDARARVRPPGRVRGGQLRVRVSRRRSHQDREVEERVQGALAPLVAAAPVRPRVEARAAKRGARVE
jgi:hypothetical protein